ADCTTHSHIRHDAHTIVRLELRHLLAVQQPWVYFLCLLIVTLVISLPAENWRPAKRRYRLAIRQLVQSLLYSATQPLLAQSCPLHILLRWGLICISQELATHYFGSFQRLNEFRLECAPYGTRLATTYQPPHHNCS